MDHGVFTAKLYSTKLLYIINLVACYATRRLSPRSYVCCDVPLRDRTSLLKLLNIETNNLV